MTIRLASSSQFNSLASRSSFNPVACFFSPSLSPQTFARFNPHLRDVLVTMSSGYLPLCSLHIHFRQLSIYFYRIERGRYTSSEAGEEEDAHHETHTDEVCMQSKHMCHPCVLPCEMYFFVEESEHKLASWHPPPRWVSEWMSSRTRRKGDGRERVNTFSADDTCELCIHQESSSHSPSLENGVFQLIL